jgi:hypothetical protein
MCGGASSSCNGGTETWTKSRNGWDWSYTKTYTVPVYLGDFRPVSGVFTITVKNDGGKISHMVTYKKGPEPKPDLKKGKDLFSEMESFMYDELTHNARSDEVKTIQGLLRPGARHVRSPVPVGLQGLSQGLRAGPQAQAGQ